MAGKSCACCAEVSPAERAESEGARSGRSKAATVVVDHPESSEKDIIARDIGGGAETEPLQDSHLHTEGANLEPPALLYLETMLCLQLLTSSPFH